MSGECSQCGEHAVDCECQEWLNAPMGAIPEMLPCPFCGWEKIRIIEDEKKEPPLQGSKYTYCWCRVCGTRGPTAYSIRDTMHDDVKACIDRWNERGGVKS